MTAGSLRLSEADPDTSAHRSLGLFASPAWCGVLQRSFGARTLVLERDTAAADVVISVIPVGPFRIGYVNFPWVDVTGGARLDVEETRALLEQLRAAGVDELNAPDTWLSVPASTRARRQRIEETRIEDLASWSLAAAPKLRRVASLAARGAAEIVPCTASDHAGFAFDLYRATVARHGVAAKYPPRYFGEVLRSAESGTSRLRARCANVAGAPAAFLITGEHDGVTYYLHGGMRRDASAAHPMDALFLESITHARDSGCRAYDFMASPKDQPNLIRFKEKWGGVTRARDLVSVALRPVRATLLGVARRAAAFLSR